MVCNLFQLLTTQTSVTTSLLPDYTGRFCINYPIQCVLGHVLLDSDPLDEVGSWKEIVQSSRNPKSEDPRLPEPKKSAITKKDKVEE